MLTSFVGFATNEGAKTNHRLSIAKRKMSYEEAIRAKHRFRDRVRAFLTLASVLTCDEVEILLGRLADMLEARPDDSDIAVKGSILTAYRELRVSGDLKQDTKLRKKMVPKWAEAAEVGRVAIAKERYFADHRQWEVSHRIWAKKSSFWERLTGFERPVLPISPSYRPEKPTWEDLMLEEVCEFRLTPASETVPSENDLSRNEIISLASPSSST